MGRKSKQPANVESQGEPYVEVTEYGQKPDGTYAVDEDGDPKTGFYWRIMDANGNPTAGGEIGPYGDFDDAITAGRQAYWEGS